MGTRGGEMFGISDPAKRKKPVPRENRLTAVLAHASPIQTEVSISISELLTV